MRRTLFVVGVLGVGGYLYWRSRRPPEERDKLGRRIMNERIAPVLMRRGLADNDKARVGVIEHVGRKSGIRRQTLIHPVELGDRFAIPMPFGETAHWPRNVIVAGGCRLRYHGRVYELTNPRPLFTDEIEGMPALERGIGRMFGDRFLVLDVASSADGSLEPEVAPAG